jgi:hypothetical protein
MSPRPLLGSVDGDPAAPDWVARVKAKRVEGEPYPPKLRDVVASYASEQRQSGRIWASIEAEIGLSSTTMRNWTRERNARGFHQLQVVDDELFETAEAAVVLTSPNGFTVTGCTLEDLARLLVVLG